MKKLLFFIMLQFTLSACGTLSRRGIEIQSYPVEKIDKTNIFVFTKRAEYELEEQENEKNALISACSRSFSKHKFKILNKVVREDSSAAYLTKGAVAIKTHHDIKEVSAGTYKKTLYLTFDKFDDRSSRIMSVHGIKAIKVGTDPMTHELIEELCDEAVKSLNLD